MKQSSLEWLVEMLVQECGLDNDGDMALFIIQQAKEIHKYEIINANLGDKMLPKDREIAEQYYKNTYEKE